MYEYLATLMHGARIKIFIGEFGSGKTEIAVNYAIQLTKHGQNTAIVDMDIVKPYFRTRENRLVLENCGVRVIAPESRFTAVDLPILPVDLIRTLYDTDRQVVIDVGGGESAIVLGQFYKQLAENDYQAYMVVNARRPFTDTPEATMKMLEKIQDISRLKITGLISNTNLAGETSIGHVMEGIALTEEISSITNLPLSWVVIPDWLVDQIGIIKYPVFVLKRYTQYPWMD